MFTYHVTLDDENKKLVHIDVKEFGKLYEAIATTMGVQDFSIQIFLADWDEWINLTAGDDLPEKARLKLILNSNGNSSVPILFLILVF